MKTVPDFSCPVSRDHEPLTIQFRLETTNGVHKLNRLLFALLNPVLDILLILFFHYFYLFYFYGISLTFIFLALNTQILYHLIAEEALVPMLAWCCCHIVVYVDVFVVVLVVVVALQRSKGFRIDASHTVVRRVHKHTCLPDLYRCPKEIIQR